MEKLVLVTGANKGIGYGIAKHLGLNGWNIILGARNEERAEKAIQDLRSVGVNVVGWVNIELSDLRSIDTAANEIKEQFPTLSLLVNNAGIPGNMAEASYETDISNIKETIDVNFIGTFALTKALIQLLSINNGRIVNITVPSEISPYWHPLAYGGAECYDGCNGYGISAEKFACGNLLRSPRTDHNRSQW